VDGPFAAKSVDLTANCRDGDRAGCYNGPVFGSPAPRAFLVAAALLAAGPPSPGADPVRPRSETAGFSERDPGPASPAVRYGLLHLEVEPGDAFIALDGESLDRGVWLISLAPGLHYVTVGKAGFLTWTRSIAIGPGESLRISVQLVKEPLK
jgi:PEGA domain